MLPFAPHQISLIILRIAGDRVRLRADLGFVSLEVKFDWSHLSCTEEVHMQNSAHFQYFEDMMALLGTTPAATIVCDQ